MEKNTVLIDLKSYDVLTESLRNANEEVRKLKEKMNNKILISKDDFYIKEKDDDINLVIKTDVLKKLTENIDGYVVQNPYFSEVTISGYQFKISKEDE